MKRSQAWLLAAVLIGLAVGIFRKTRSDGPVPPGTPATDSPLVAERTRATRPDPEVERESRDAAARRRIESDWLDLIAWLESEPRPSDQEIQERLLATRVEWSAMDLQVLSEMISKLLESGRDVPTGLPFRVGPHGFLKSWPTLRVFLLDALVASDPEMAAAIAREVLDATPSGDEYAVALRSLTRKGLGRASDQELLARFQTMIERPAWLDSAGFAEAFDLPRLLGSAEAAKTLANWNSAPLLRDRALDEFAAEFPAVAIEAVEQSNAIHGRTRATIMARADPADAAQLQAVDRYLRQPGLDPGEAAAFLDIFPLRSATTGFRLYGKPPAPYEFEAIAAGDRAALEQVQRWAGDPNLAHLKENLTSLQQRLQEWVGQTR